MKMQDLMRFIEEQHLFSKDAHILLAVSGGIDSVVMADLVHRAKYRFAIAHCNFGLRGAESDGDEAFVRQMAVRFRVPFHSITFSTKAEAARTGESLQMTARRLRYDWFEKIRAENGYQVVATAHHLDDQAETFLINLIRGTGIAGLHGIPVINGTVVRPMLFTYRRDIQAYAEENHLEYREDHSNRETKYLRNKIRHKVIPLLCTLNPDFITSLSDTVMRLREFEKTGHYAVDEWQKKSIVREGQDLVIHLEHLQKNQLAPTLAWEFLSRFGFTETRLRNLIGSLQVESRQVFLSPSHRLVKERGKLVVSLIRAKDEDREYPVRAFTRTKTIAAPLPLSFRRITNPGGNEIPATGRIASLDSAKISFPLTLRKWRHGDAFVPLGLKKKKKVSDFMIDCKFSTGEKEQTWVLCSGPDILWIIGHRIDHRFRITAATREILRVEMK